MKRQKIGILTIPCLLFLVSFARGQSISQMKRCNELVERNNEALASDDDHKIIDSARDFLADCPDTGTKRFQASFLHEIGTSLINLKQFEDAIPVLRRCVAIDEEFAPCWYRLGKASADLHRRFDAKTFWKKTIEIGGFDKLNAVAIQEAKRDLADLELVEKTFGDQLPADPSAPESNHSAPDTSGSTLTNHSFGTGFFVNNEGAMLTNNHVVAGCKTLTTRDGKPLRVISTSTGSDLALLRADVEPTSVAVFRIGPAPKLGDSVVAFGFPLPGILSSEGNVSTGVLSATSGLQNDVRFVQISAPVQPGNSGGPLFDSSGHVIGVVVAKLDALRVARATGDVPQNVNFAVHWSQVRSFLDEEGIHYQKKPSQHDTSTRDIAARAAQMAVAIDCTE